MSQETATAPLTIRTQKTTMDAIDALAGVMDRSRNYVVNQAIQQYLEANAWQIERIRAGIAAADAGQLRPADEVLAEVAARHGWPR